MRATYFDLKKLIAVGSASVFALLAAPLVTDMAFNDANPVVAYAADSPDHGTDHVSGGHEGGKGGKGGSGGAQKGQGGSHEGGAGGASKSVEALVTTEEDEGGGKGKMGSGVHGQGKFQDNKMGGGGASPGPGGVNDEPNDAKGPRYSGGAGTGSGGGKPPWAQEGLPKNPDGSEVELGRLNVARAPGKLLDRQLVEAIAAVEAIVAPAGTSVYEAANLAAAIAAITTDALRVDSPLANLALLKDLLTDGVLDGNYVTTDGLANAVVLLDTPGTMTTEEFVALLVGSAADKTITITSGTVGSLEVILGLEMGDDAAIATMADEVRAAILYAHDN